MDETESSDLSRLAERTKRPVRVYQVPAAIGGGDFKSLGLALLTADDELEAQERAAAGGGAGARLFRELALQSLAEVNGSPVSIAEGTAESAWNRMHPKLRSLVTTEYRTANIANDGELADFRKGAVVKLA